VLAFFSAMKNYGYVDRLGNALNEITAVEALKDAIRDFHSTCLDSPDKCVEVKMGSEALKLKCPEIDVEELHKDLEEFITKLSGKSGDVIVKETRKLALRALASKEKVKLEKC